MYNAPLTLTVFLFGCLFACSTGYMCQANYIIDGIKYTGQRMFGEAVGTQLNFDQMLSDLEDMRSLFRHAKVDGIDVSQFAEWEDITYELTYINRFFEDNDNGDCNWRHDFKLYKVRKSLQQYQEYQVNVVPFLLALAQRYYANCATIVRRKVAEDINADQSHILKQLNQVVREALSKIEPPREKTSKHGWLIQYHSLVDDDLLALLRSKGVFEDNVQIGRAEFLEKFKRLFGEPCTIVWFKISPLADVIRACPVPEFLDLVDRETREWVEIDEVCVGLGLDTMAPHLYDQYFAPTGNYLAWAHELIDLDQ